MGIYINIFNNGTVCFGTKAEIINCANNGSVVSKETAAGIATTYGAITVKNCLNIGNVSGLLASYAIAYCNNYYDDSINDFMILNSFYVQTTDVNTEIESSNIVIKNDLSKAVSESDISSGYVAAMLNNSYNTAGVFICINIRIIYTIRYHTVATDNDYTGTIVFCIKFTVVYTISYF